MRRATFITYLILVHGLLALVLWKSDFLLRVERKLGWTPQVQELAGYYRTMLHHQVRMDGIVPDKAVVFIGDSLIQGLYTDAVVRPSVNYGIGGDTTVGVLARLSEYRSLLRASAVVLAIGVNDMKFRDNQEIIHNYRSILQILPRTVPLVSSAVLPVNEAMISSRSITNIRMHR